MRADRLLSLLLLLQTRGRLTAQALAERLEVSLRTIYRDLDALSSAGIPIFTERGPGGGCELIDGYQTTLTGLSSAEVRALFLLGVSGPLADLGLDQALEKALLKLAAALPPTSRTEAVQARQLIHLDATTPFHAHQALPHLKLLEEAVWQNRTLLLSCEKEDRQLIDPYGLVASAGEWYLVGVSTGSIQIWCVSRIQAASMTNQSFQRPPAFDLATSWTEHLAPSHESSSAQTKKKNKLIRSLPLIVLRNTQPPYDRGVWRDRASSEQKDVDFFEEQRAA